MTVRIVEVAVPLPVWKTFHYKIPVHLEMSVQEGSEVLVSFRNKKLLGYVIAPAKTPHSHDKIKDILEVPSSAILLSAKMLSLLKWISSYYAAPIGEVIKTAIPSHLNVGKTKQKNNLVSPIFSSPQPKFLTEHQNSLLNILEKALFSNQYSPFLLHGVTGSGKTEIYLRIIQKALEQKKQALVLVPEISLTPQLIGRFESCFPQKIAVLHSRLTPNQRHGEWLKIYHQRVPIAIGTRSAIFAPLEHLSVIIVDEEHDSSFKQEEKLRYNARDIALIRGKLENALVLLGSATPSLESYFNSQHRKINLLTLPHRIYHRPLPKVEIIDLKNEEKNFGQKFIFSNALLSALKETLFQKSQAILLLNRRGYAPFLLCQECGYTSRCSHCSVSLTLYASQKKLICHYCSQALPVPPHCPDCHGNQLTGLGIGTEKVEEELKKIFPQTSIGRMDRSSTQKKDAFFKILSDFSNQKIDILIGTQMLAKGHDFPNVVLVGVILAETSLNLPDFRAPEKTFQLLTQVTGRAGRGEKPGRVIIQTFNPSHYSLKFTEQHYYEGFYKTELLYRQEAFYPPFCKLVHFKCSHSNLKKAFEKIKHFGKLLRSIQSQVPDFLKLELLGPSPAPLSKIKDKYRFHILLKSPSHLLIKNFLDHLLKHEKELLSSPAIHIDVDPLNLL